MILEAEHHTMNIAMGRPSQNVIQKVQTVIMKKVYAESFGGANSRRCSRFCLQDWCECRVQAFKMCWRISEWLVQLRAVIRSEFDAQKVFDSLEDTALHICSRFFA